MTLLYDQESPPETDWKRCSDNRSGIWMGLGNLRCELEQGHDGPHEAVAWGRMRHYWEDVA